MGIWISLTSEESKLALLSKIKMHTSFNSVTKVLGVHAEMYLHVCTTANSIILPLFPATRNYNDLNIHQQRFGPKNYGKFCDRISYKVSNIKDVSM